MQTEILIVSYQQDVPWLQWCVKSIEKFAAGFSGTTVVFPADEPTPEIRGVKWARYSRTSDRRKWHLDAQRQKCLADQYCPNADFILHLDSDCIFTEPVTPEDYFANGKPVMLIEEYSRLKDAPWQGVTEEALGISCPYETMRRHPQVNPRGVYADLRAHVEATHQQPFKEYVLSRKADFPWGFSEHNAIGAFARFHPKWWPAYHWVDLAKEVAPNEKLKQFWSYGPIDQPQGTPHDKDTVTPIQVIRKILG